MTIGIEAGASQHQLSMKVFVVHALFRRQPWNRRPSPTDADLAQQGPFEKDPVRFPESQRDTIPKPSA
jgi:hypothetical protein